MGGGGGGCDLDSHFSITTSQHNQLLSWNAPPPPPPPPPKKAGFDEERKVNNVCRGRRGVEVGRGGGLQSASRSVNRLKSGSWMCVCVMQGNLISFLFSLKNNLG